MLARDEVEAYYFGRYDERLALLDLLNRYLEDPHRREKSSKKSWTKSFTPKRHPRKPPAAKGLFFSYVGAAPTSQRQTN
jgi:hypothetical protein